MAGKGEVIQGVAAERPLVDDPLGRLALAGQFIALHRHPAERLAVKVSVAAHRNAAHVFRATGHYHIHRATGDGASGQVHSDFTRTAFTVDGQPGNADRPACTQQCGTGDIGGLLTDLRHAAEDHIFDLLRSHIYAFQQAANHQRAQMIGAHSRKAATKPADGRAHRINDNDLVHSALALRPDPGTCLPSA
ncbi:hypothetical protein D3C79_802820 [compost metagenome]